MLARERGEAEISQPLLTTFDDEIAGRIVVCSDVVLKEEQEALAATLRAAGIDCRPVNQWGDHPFTFSLDRLHARGLDFQFYDPRGLYPGEDRMSCVFVRSNAFPMLDGRLAKVSGPERCARITVDHLRGTEWYVECPFLHLRDYLEDWIDMVLSWMKVFYMPDLYYFHGEPLAEFARLSADFEDRIAKHGKDAAREMIFERIVRRFVHEADIWAREMGAL